LWIIPLFIPLSGLIAREAADIIYFEFEGRIWVKMMAFTVFFLKKKFKIARL
jgi:hypothetical protein